MCEAALSRMAIVQDHTFSFEAHGGYTMKRFILLGAPEYTPVTYTFEWGYKSRVCRKEFPRKVFKWMLNNQKHTPVFIASSTTRSWWWFQDAFYNTNETTKDPHVFKGLLIEQAMRAQRKEEKARAAARGEAPPKRPRKSREQKAATAIVCPYDVLGISKTASQDEIKTAYRKKISENHPDKVAALSIELKALAEEMSKRINSAYEELKK